MARVLFTVWPFSGHVNPCVWLADELRESGHDVAFCTGSLQHDPIAARGLEHFPMLRTSARIAELVGSPAEDSADLYWQLTQRYGAGAGLGTLKKMYLEWIVGTIPAQVADFHEAASRWGASAIVCDPFMWGPVTIMHETDRIPVIPFSFFAGCLIPGPDAPPPGLGLRPPRTASARFAARLVGTAMRFATRDVLAAVDRIRMASGLKPLRMPVARYAGTMPLYIVASSPEFDYQRTDLPPNIVYAGSCLPKPVHMKKPAEWMETIGVTRRAIYVTEGTSQAGEPVLIRAAARALAGEPFDVIISVGPHRDPSMFRELHAPNIRFEQWVDQNALFPRLSLVISNGGSNTVRQALHFGLPLVVVPMEWDQLESAQRVVECGAGMRLNPKSCSAGQLKRRITETLDNPAYRNNAQLAAKIFMAQSRTAINAVHGFLKALDREQPVRAMPSNQGGYS